MLFAGRPEPLAFGEPDGPPTLPAGLTPLALVSFSDELRPGVRATLDEFAASGIEVKIISGDDPRTVQALARQAGVHTLHLREGMDAYCEVVLDETERARGAAARAPATGFAEAPPAEASRRPGRADDGSDRRVRRRPAAALARRAGRHRRACHHLRARHARAEGAVACRRCATAAATPP